MKKLLLGLILSGIMSLHLSAMTAGDMERQIRYRIVDSTIAYNNPRWSSAAILDMENRAQEQIARDTLCCFKSTLIDPVTGQILYTKPSDIITFDRVSYQSNSATDTYKKLTCFTLPGKDRDTNNNSWMHVSSGMPTNYYELGNSYGLFPSPGMAYCWPGALRIEYFYFPPDMTSSSSIPFGGIYELYTYHQLIVYAASILCLEAEGRDTSTFTTKYLLELAKMKDQIKYKPDYQGNMTNDAHQ